MMSGQGGGPFDRIRSNTIAGRAPREEEKPEPKDAWQDLQAVLKPGEIVLAVVFGNWGSTYHNHDDDRENAPALSSEPEPAIPLDRRGVVLSGEEARPYMVGWSLDNGFGTPECYAIRIWTQTRVLWVTKYDGSTKLDSAFRDPTSCMPYMPGGGG